MARSKAGKKSGGGPWLASLMGVHKHLDALFQEHQIHLMEGRLPAARKAFRAYSEALRGHIRDEEGLILPLFEERCGSEIEGARPEFFHAEHRKIRQFLQKMARKLVSSAMSRPEGRLELLDLEAQFKGYMLHHDLRERNGLYPQLDLKTEPAERREILERLRVPL